MKTFTEMHELYKNDVAFHHMVNALRKTIEDFHLSPSEVRGAAMFAVYLHEMNNPQLVTFDPYGVTKPRAR